MMFVYKMEDGSWYPDTENDMKEEPRPRKCNMGRGTQTQRRGHPDQEKCHGRKEYPDPEKCHWEGEGTQTQRNVTGEGESTQTQRPVTGKESTQTCHREGEYPDPDNCHRGRREHPDPEN